MNTLLVTYNRHSSYMYMFNIYIQIPDWLAANKHHIPFHILLCNTAKGLYVNDNSLLSEALLSAIGRNQPYAVLSGPSFATEIIDNVPTAGIFYIYTYA